MDAYPPRAWPRWVALLLAGFALFVTTPACSSPSVDPLIRRPLVVDGVPRLWYEYRPPGLLPGPVPLVIMLHGAGQRATTMAPFTGIDAEARRDGFIVVFPEGTNRSWNAVGCCGPAMVHHVDDVRALTVLVNDLIARGEAQPSRVYVAGFSNGAMMTYRLACARPDLFAGAAVVEGALTSPCPVHRPIDLLVIHQAGDVTVPVGGGRRTLSIASAPFPPVRDSLDSWLAAGGCHALLPPFALPSRQQPVVRASVNCPGGAKTTLEVLAGGAHYWPRARRSPLDATVELAIFFSLRRE